MGNCTSLLNKWASPSTPCGTPVGTSGVTLAGHYAINSPATRKRDAGPLVPNCPRMKPALEAHGLAFAVSWDKPGGFVGHEALLPAKAAGVKKRLALFQLRNPTPFSGKRAHPPQRENRRLYHHGAYGHTPSVPPWPWVTFAIGRRNRFRNSSLPANEILLNGNQFRQSVSPPSVARSRPEAYSLLSRYAALKLRLEGLVTGHFARCALAKPPARDSPGKGIPPKNFQKRALWLR